MELTRRDACGMIGAAGGLLMASSAAAQSQEPKAVKAVPPGGHVLVPLPFNPANLKNISGRMITSHHENNYAGALKNLNKVETELAGITKDTPGYTVAGLKERELTFANSVVLHELYFGNLGGDGKAGGAVEKALGAAYGTLGKWEEQFRATGASLGGGSGWVILSLSLHDGALRTNWSGNHTQTLALGQPLLVMDMYEHSYQLDFGAAAGKYIDAFFQNIQWDEVNRRYERGLKALGALRQPG